MHTRRGGLQDAVPSGELERLGRLVEVETLLGDQFVQPVKEASALGERLARQSDNLIKHRAAGVAVGLPALKVREGRAQALQDVVSPATGKFEIVRAQGGQGRLK